MEEVFHVPTGQLTVEGDFTHTVLVVLPKELHPNNRKDKDDDGQNQSQVPQSAHRVPNDLNESV